MPSLLHYIYLPSGSNILKQPNHTHTTTTTSSVFSFILLHSILLFCISSSLKLSSAKVLGNESDTLALLAFKSGITHDPFGVMSSSNDSQHFCQWEGVTCGRRHQRVKILNLRSKSLAGSISPHLGNMSFLRAIDLIANNFDGKIPQEFGRLYRLTYLKIANNSLMGTIPLNISLCSKLTGLRLHNNNLVGKIPMELESLSKLVTLNLHGNRLTGGIPSFLGNLTSLETLSISQNSFGGNIPSTLGQLKNLRNLALNQCKLSGMFPSSLYSNLSKLEILSIALNQLSGNLPSKIGLMLPNLQQFLIEDNKFSGLIPTSLFNASNLWEVDMEDNHFSGTIPTNVGTLKKLTFFFVTGNDLGSGKDGDLDFLTSLTNCTNLQALGIGENRFGGTLPASIGNLSNQLTFLVFGQNQISGSIPMEIENLRSLGTFSIYSNSFTGRIPAGIGKLQNLGRLYLLENRLSGPIPSSIRNMSKLFDLSLAHNILEGDISSGLENQMLEEVDLSYNQFTGNIPQQITGISSRLRTIVLTHNSSNGSIPLTMGDSIILQIFDISENRISGEIPNSLGSCSSLENLYIQGNFFQGPLPSTFGSLKGLKVLDASRNNLSGEIPKELEMLPFLTSLNLSFNNIMGEVPSKGIFQNATEFSIFGNHGICGGIPELGLHKCDNQKSEKSRNHLAIKVTLGVLIPIFTILLFLVIYLRKKPNQNPLPESIVGDLSRVSYNDLHNATNGFSSENLIGVGSYGSVYKGILPRDQHLVAVKVLNLMKRGASKSFIAECQALKEVRHRNLVKVLTVCSSVDYNGNDFKALIFEFMPNGSLECWLHPSSDSQHPQRNLNIHQRLDMAIDVASSLDYLHNHCEKTLVHCDLKPSNVLLGNDMTAQVGDFGLAKFLDKNACNYDTNSVHMRGTIGYIPPEYGIGAEVSTQGDVYSYGILLLEMFTGKRPTDPIFNNGMNLHEFSKTALHQRAMDIIDICLVTKNSQEEGAESVNQLTECFSSVIRIGVACSMEHPTERMDIEDVLNGLCSLRKAISSTAI